MKESKPSLIEQAKDNIFPICCAIFVAWQGFHDTDIETTNSIMRLETKMDNRMTNIERIGKENTDLLRQRYPVLACTARMVDKIADRVGIDPPCDLDLVE
jgi:hypothetical protein